MLSVVKHSCNLDEFMLLFLHKAMVSPFLEYGNVTWDLFNNRLEAPGERTKASDKNGKQCEVHVI